MNRIGSTGSVKEMVLDADIVVRIMYSSSLLIAVACELFSWLAELIV